MNQRLRPAVTDPVILMFSRQQVEAGDIDDPRELFEVPQVRAYISRLDQAWPYWFLFLSQADESIKLLESCLCETIEVVPGVTSIDLGQLGISLARHFAAMHRLRRELDLPEEICEEVAEGIIGMFRNAAVERVEGDEHR